MIITEKNLPMLLKGKTLDELISIYLDYRNITKITFKSLRFDNIQFLSLRNNNIKEIDFLGYFTNLWYLDLRDNPVTILFIKIDNYAPLKILNTLGYLGVTIDQYSKQSFTSLRKLNIGILKVNESFEDLYLSSNLNIIPNIIKCNEYIVLLNELNEISKQNIRFSHVNSEEMLTNQKGYIKDFVLFLEEWQRDYNIVSNLKLELKSDHPNHEFYLQIKKRRLIYLYNIHESLLILNKDENSIFDLNKENSLVREFRFFENRFLFIKDEFLKLIILLILILYIVGIITKGLAVFVIKHICKRLLHNEANTNDIIELMSIEKIYLLGLYYKMIDEMNKIDFLKGTQNNIYTTIIHLTEFKRIMQMDNLIYNLNDIKRKEDSYIIDFANIPNFDLRKKEIINRQINFIDKNLNLLNDSLVLIQHLYDFMLMNNIDKRVRNKIIESKDYMNFLEIRGCYFLYIDNKSNKNDIFDCLSDRKFAEINNKKFSNLRMSFLSKPIITRKNEIKKVETSKEKSSNNRVNALSNNNSIDQNDVNNKTAYHFMPKSRSTGFKKQMNSYKSSQLLKVSPDPFFLTNAFTVNNLVEQKNLKRTNSQENINSEFKLVDAVTNTFNTLKTKEKIMPKTQTKFSINDDKLKNFCRDLLKMKETKTDKVSAHSGFISSTVQIEKEKPPLIPTKQAKSISSNFKTKIKSSDEFMNQEEKEIKKYYKYLSVLNKIHNLFILGSTRVDTPFNKRYRLYQELKCKDVIRTIHSSNTINEANSSPKEVFRHNKPLSIPYNQKLQKIRRSTIHKNDKPGIHIPGLSKVEIKSKFNGNKIVENTFYRNDFKEKKEINMLNRSKSQLLKFDFSNNKFKNS